MTNKLQQRKDSGFTIIEVLIVLAIAGLIMVVVFLAVPALQRSGRNNALNTNANNVYTGVNNYVSNNNGTVPGAISKSGTTVTIAPASGTANNETVTVDSSIKSVALGADASGLSTSSSVGDLKVVIGDKAICNDTKSGLDSTKTTSSRAVAVLYVAESSSGGKIVKCLD